MINGNELSIKRYFENVTDPREANRRHKLIDIITIAICAVICHADTWVEIEEFGRSKYDWFNRFLELPHGIPSHDTISRVFRMINPIEFQQAFMNWVRAMNQLVSQVIAIDGKTLRRSHDKSSGKAAIHMVSAWAKDNGIVIGQVKTDEKSNEITAIPELLSALSIDGCIVTIDAMGCQIKIAKLIIEKGADYLLGLKGNQGSLCHDVELFFQKSLKDESIRKDWKFYETTDGDHGRIEIRRYYTTSDIQWLQGKERWSNIKTIGMVERERHIGERISSETSYYITSLDDDAEQFAQAVRGHWAIENSLHWVLDICFREDESRIRKDNAPENFAVLRHMAMNLLKKVASPKKSIKTKRLKAGWDNNYLAKVLSG
jgi:predicted transposase YbfD/YdcC